MPYIAPPFTPSVTISGTDLIRNTDEKLQTIANDVGDYLEVQSQAMYTDLDAQMTVIEGDYNTVLKPEIEAKMDDLLSINPDGTYYTKNAIDTLVASKVAKVTSTDNAIARFDGTTGAIQNSGVVVNDNGNVGIGVTPSAWTIGGKTLEIVSAGNAINSQNNQTIISTNAYYNSGWKYGGNYPATTYAQYNGTHYWQTAPSGIAGSPITWTTGLTVPLGGGIQLPNTAITGATTLDWYEEATATLTANGMTTAPTGTGRFTRNGDTVTALIPTISGTSNATTFTITGIPTNFRPSSDRNVLVRTQDNGGAIIVSNATINSSGVLTIYKDAGTTAFTASGTKSVQAIQIKYHI